jgi:NitT/TauT family transport system substrate-binding protein
LSKNAQYSLSTSTAFPTIGVTRLWHAFGAGKEMVMHSLKIVLASLAIAMAATGAAAAEPLLIRNAYVVPTDWEPLLAAKKDLAKHWGTSYVMEAQRYQGTPPMITALANGELEIAPLAYSTLGIAIENAGISDLRVISDQIRDGDSGYFSNQFFVRKDSGIKRIEDLKGKVLATNILGAGVDIAMKAGLKKHGLKDKVDYTVIEAPFPTMPAILNDKKADLVTAVMPFAANALLNQIGVPLFTQSEGMGPTQFLVWTARQTWLDKNRAALVDYMEDMMRIERWYLDPKNHDEVAKLVGGMTKTPPENLGWLFTKKDYYHDPNMMPDLAALQRNVDTTYEMGFIKSKLDVKAHSDLGLIEEAAKRLK